MLDTYYASIIYLCPKLCTSAAGLLYDNTVCQNSNCTVHKHVYNYATSNLYKIKVKDVS